MTLAEHVIAVYARCGWTIATAESCTGGLLAGALTDIAGSSAVFDRGFVTYSNRAKVGMIGVSPQLIEEHGAVSKEVALAMVQGAIARSTADVVVAITGIAGPSGGTLEKPVGLVHFACLKRGQQPTSLERRYGDASRASVRGQSVTQALQLFLEAAA